MPASAPRACAPRPRSRTGRVSCSWLGQQKACGTLVLVRHGQTEWDAEDRFTGWADPHLSETGKLQVDAAARALLESGFAFDVAYTSMLKRAVETTWLLLKELGLIHLPVWKHWRLNDRSYGSLTGHSIDEMRDTYGDAAVQSWRRSFDSRPPPFKAGHPFDPANSRRYARWEDRNGNVQPVQLPGGESLGDTISRCEPVWREITRDLKEGKNVLVAAHGNSIRAIVQAIDGVPHSTIAEVEIPACIPLVYRFDRGTNGELVPVPSAANPPISGEFLAPASELAEAQASIRNASLRRYGFAGFGGFPESLSPSESVYLPAEAPSMTAATPDGSALSMAPSWKVAPRPTAEQYVVIIRHGKTENNKLGIFTGWDDVELAAEGREEALCAGALLAQSGVQFDVVYTSWLSRAIETAWLVLCELDQMWLPIHKSWRLNERMYGALTGLSKKKTRSQYGIEQFTKWRRGYDTKPPAVSSFSQYYPGNDQRYVQNIRDVRVSGKETLIRSLASGRLEVHRKLPRCESLKDCMDRTIPYWANTIVPDAIASGKNVLVASSENAIRGLLMHLFDIPPDRISEIEIPTGLPLVYDVRYGCLRLLGDGDFSAYNFGKSGELLFTPCELPDEAFEDP